MKLYAEYGEVLLDYSDIDPKLPLDKAAMEYRSFIWEFGGEPTLKPKVKRIINCNRTNMNLYYQVQSLLTNVTRIASDVRYRRDYIEVSDSLKEYIEELRERCKELYEAEQEKEARRRIAAHWQSVCKHGCKGCSELRRTEFDDGYACNCTGEELETRCVTESYGKIFSQFNYVPFPADDCPFNTEKIKELKI